MPSFTGRALSRSPRKYESTQKEKGIQMNCNLFGSNATHDYNHTEMEASYIILHCYSLQYTMLTMYTIHYRNYFQDRCWMFYRQPINFQMWMLFRWVITFTILILTPKWLDTHYTCAVFRQYLGSGHLILIGGGGRQKITHEANFFSGIPEKPTFFFKNHHIKHKLL